jgi:hypothetical protein
MREGGYSFAFNTLTMRGDHVEQLQVGRTQTGIEVSDELMTSIFGEELMVGRRRLRLPAVVVQEVRQEAEDLWATVLVPLHSEAAIIWAEVLPPGDDGS